MLQANKSTKSIGSSELFKEDMICYKNSVFGSRNQDSIYKHLKHINQGANIVATLCYNKNSASNYLCKATLFNEFSNSLSFNKKALRKSFNKKDLASTLDISSPNLSNVVISIIVIENLLDVIDTTKMRGPKVLPPSSSIKTEVKST